MQFTYDENAGNSSLIIKDDVYKYLIKARRHKIGDKIYFRNLKDNFIYLYKLTDISKKDASFTLLSSEEKIVKNPKKLHLAWCVIDPKSIEKNIASLNELGVDKITFIYSDFSQKNFKPNFQKLEKILINSSSQCGRSDIIKLDICDSLEKFMSLYDDVYFLDFSQDLLEYKKDDINTIVIGCEGGFSQDEKDSFDKSYVVNPMNTSKILLNILFSVLLIFLIVSLFYIFSK